MGWKLRLAATLMLILVSPIVSANQLPAGWKTYENTEYGFTVAYPTDFTFLSGRLDYDAQGSYLPVCDLSTVACFIDNSNDYRNTNFSAAGVSVNIIRDARTETGCYTINTGIRRIQKITINGIHFHYGLTGQVGTSHSEGGPVYRAFRDGVCFEVAAGIAAVDRDVTDPPMNEFNHGKVEQRLDEIVHTFRFTGPVVDGPGWKVYNDSVCGARFEYPDADTVLTDSESGITCAMHFEDHGRRYSLSAKSNLNNHDALEAWLKLAGYPGLAGVEPSSKSQLWSEYKAGPYFYIFGQVTLYTLNVSDTSGHPLDPEGDRIFSHFLHSFRP